MKILMVNKFLYPRGGAESYMLQLGESFEKSGHTVEYFGMYDEKNTVGNSAGLYTRNMDFHSKNLERMLYPFKIIYSAEAYRKIGKVIDEFKPDIVHMNNINFQLTPSIIYAVKKRKLPLAWTIHDYQMICPNHLMYNFKEGGSCTKCVQGSKLNCLKYNCIHCSKVKSFFGVLEAWLYKRLKTYKLVDLFICPSNFLENKLLEADAMYKGKTFTIHNFINKFEVQAAHKNNEEYIVFAGRLSKEKGIELLAKSAELLPEYKFVVVGNGPDEDVLKGKNNIQLTGFLNGNELTDMIFNAKALIAPSVCFENCPLSILEAHSMGVPVITMNSGGMAELVKDGVTGTLIQTPCPESVADSVRKLMYDEQYKKIKRGCEEYKNSILSVEEYGNIMLEKYRELTAE